MSQHADAAPTEAAPGKAAPPAPAVMLGVIAALGAILALLLAVFIMPSLKSGPHDLSLGFVGSSAQLDAARSSLQASEPDAWELVRFDDRDALDKAIQGRDVVGGLVFAADGTLDARVTSAGSTAISGTVASTAHALAAPAGSAATVTDVVPLPADDPTGVGIGGLAFPLVFGGIVPVVAFRAAFGQRTAWRLAGLVGFALFGGAVVAAALQYAFGSITDAFWPVAGSMALGIAALSLPLAGLQDLFGTKGFTIGAMSMMFLGNPLAGIATTGAWLPAGLGAFGQLLPPGAAGSLVRSAAYFEGAGSTVALLTLIGWIAAGAAMLALGVRRRRSAAVTTAAPAEALA